MKAWRHYEVLVKSRNGFWVKDQDEGSLDRYTTRLVAVERAAWLYQVRAVGEVEVHEMTDEVIWANGEEKNDGAK
jgi:hypothetical protein